MVLGFCTPFIRHFNYQNNTVSWQPHLQLLQMQKQWREFDTSLVSKYRSNHDSFLKEISVYISQSI
jgi:hypothetical protein